MAITQHKVNNFISNWQKKLVLVITVKCFSPFKQAKTPSKISLNHSVLTPFYVNPRLAADQTKTKHLAVLARAGFLSLCMMFHALSDCSFFLKRNIWWQYSRLWLLLKAPARRCLLLSYSLELSSQNSSDIISWFANNTWWILVWSKQIL